MKNSFLFLLVMALVLVTGDLLQAADVETPTHALMTSQEQEIQMRAKKRRYPGGKDEEPMKVQAQLPTVTRRMTPLTEAPIEEPSAAGDSTED